MAKIKIVGADIITKTKNGGVVLTRVPADQVQYVGDQLGQAFDFSQSPDSARGSVKCTIRDASNALAFQKVIGGEIGVEQLGSIGFAFTMGVNLKVGTEGTIGSIVDTDRNYFHTWGVSATNYSTGSYELEFAGGMPDGANGSLSCTLSDSLSENPTVQLASMYINGRNNGLISIKYDFIVE